MAAVPIGEQGRGVAREPARGSLLVEGFRAIWNRGKCAAMSLGLPNGREGIKATRTAEFLGLTKRSGIWD